MASSSVSQESLDINEEYELNARRTRIRTLRARGALHKTGDRDSETSGDIWDINGDGGPQGVTNTGQGVGVSEQVHESPTRSSAAQRAKDKRSRPNHLQKGKLPKDKRKLREKRRSTGVVHLASTESTGDSLDDDDDEEKVLTEAKRNTSCNEVIDADNPQTPSEVMRRIKQFQSLTVTASDKMERPGVPRGFSARRNKSPSDLEADLEDNQDYDSTVSQSDSNLTLISQSRIRDSEQAPSVPARTYNQSSYNYSSPKSFRHVDSPQTESDSKSVGASPVSQFSVQSRYRTNDKSTDSDPMYPLSSQPRSPKSPRSSRLSSQNANNMREPVGKPVSSVLSRYQERQDRPEDFGGYRSRFRDKEFMGVRGPIGQQFAASLKNKENKDDDIVRKKLEKDLERERDENRRLQRVLEEKDRRIADLERQVAMMNRDLDDYEEDNAKLQVENRALIQAVGQLSTHV